VFVLLPTYRAPLEEVDALLEEHRDWLDEHIEAGRFLLAGRQQPRDGGFILAADGDRRELEHIAATDPFSTAGLVNYQVLEVLPTAGTPAVLQALAAHGVAVSVPVRATTSATTSDTTRR
jgi:uncharacterized protein YciI